VKTPEVRIYFSWLLYDNVSKDLFEKYNDGSQKLSSKSDCLKWAEAYRNEWAKYEAKVLPALSEVSGLTFYRQVIDVACAPWLAGQSDPLLMSYYYEPDQFIDQLTHELCHVLLTDNTMYSDHSSSKWINLSERWAKLFGEVHDFTTLVHIPVHALCKYIFVDVLKEPGRVERDVADCAGNEPYKKSWDYVNAHDYHEIIEQLKADYKQLQKELA
jgi:hypothetical protein